MTDVARLSPRRFACVVKVATIALAMAAIGVAAPNAAFAQGAFAAAAKVDDKVITSFDVEQRVVLLKLEGRKGSDAALSRRALEELIEETLKLDEAGRKSIKVTDEQITDAIKRIAKNNRRDLKAFLGSLTKAGVSEAAFRRRIKAQMAWNAVLRKRYGDRIKPTDGEIDTMMSAVTTTGPTRYDVKQVVVPVKASAPRPKVIEAAKRAEAVRKSLKGCGSIPSVAKKHRSVAGNIGVVTAEQMPDPVRKAVLKLKPGQSARPLRSRNGIHVIILCGVKAGGGKLTRDQATGRVSIEKAARFSESYLSELRQNALIETPS